MIDGGVLRGLWKCGGWFEGGWLAGVSVRIVFCPDLAVWGEFLIDFISSFAVDDEDEVSGGYLFVVLGTLVYQICSTGEMHLTSHNFILHKNKLHHVKEHPRFAHIAYSDYLIYPITDEFTIMKGTTSSSIKTQRVPDCTLN